jgi:hypothetical protein
MLLLKRCASLLCNSLFLLLLVVSPQIAYAGSGIGFQPVSSDELSLTTEPAAPNAPAIILYRQVDRNDNRTDAHQDNYVRIKILTDAGRSYADVEIPFVKGTYEISNLHARSIAPNGTITNYEGKVFEKTIVKARGIRYLAKLFTLPNAQKGSIIEYYYTYDYPDNWIFDSRWVLSENLFTKLARFSLKSYQPEYGQINLHWSWRGLPPGTNPPAQGSDKIIRLEARNIPAFHDEDFMPPEGEMKSRVDFIYSWQAPEHDKDKFWMQVGKKRYEQVNNFLGKRGALQSAVAQTVSSSDDPETKLRKLYARVQQLRNTTYEYQLTTQEEKRENVKPNKNIEDVWKRGSGDATELTWLYLGLVRDAGLDAYPVYVADRENYFFDPSQMDEARLDANVVLVKLNGKDTYYDPGAAYVPVGMLPWYETGVQGLRLDKDGGSWIQTPLPPSSASQVVRTAKLKVNSEGDVEGKLTILYTGMEALTKRTEERHEDDQQRKKFLEDIVKSYISASADVELTNQPDWKSSSPELTAEFSVKIPGWIAAAGKHMLLPVGIFSGSEKGLFDHAEREHPIYFEFPFQKIDNITLQLPEGVTVSNVPAPQKTDGGAVFYSLAAEKNKDELVISRALRVDLLILPVTKYPAVRNFFQAVRTGDDAQVMLQAQVAAASK